jgi:hypothetical protein
MSAELLRRAAQNLRDPYRNSTRWDLPLADLLERSAVLEESGIEPVSVFGFLIAVARAVLREPDQGGEAAREAPPKSPNDLAAEPGPVPKGGE